MSKENVFGKDGIEKLKKLAEGIDICMFCTGLSERPVTASPMSVQEVDDQGNIWFLASKDSKKYQNLSKESAVQLLYADNSSYKYLSVYGAAETSDDQAHIDRYWTKMMEGWFEKGKEDPNIVLIKVIPDEVYYWDTKDSKMISFAKVLWTAVTGNKTDIGLEGSIEV